MTQRFAAILVSALAIAGPAGAEQFNTEKVEIDVTPIASGLRQPWAVEVLPVREIVERVGLDMDEDPDYDDLLLGRPTFAGVESVSGEAVIIRITAKAAPEKQLSVARTIRERMKVAFDRASIVVPVVVRPLPTMPGAHNPPRTGP